MFDVLEFLLSNHFFLPALVSRKCPFTSRVLFCTASIKIYLFLWLKRVRRVNDTIIDVATSPISYNGVNFLHQFKFTTYEPTTIDI